MDRIETMWMIFILLEVLLAATTAPPPVRPWHLRHKRGVRTRGDLCKGKEDNVLYAVPDDCTKYILCTGEYEYEASCPAGLFYDPELQACNFDEGGLCAARMQQQNQVEREETIPPEPKTQPPPLPGADGVGTPIDLDADFCKNRADGTYSHPERCTHYVLCSNNAVHITECPNGLVFNPDIKNCDFDTSGACKKKGGSTAVDPRGDALKTPTPAVSTNQLPQVPDDIASQVATVMPGALETAMTNLMVKMRTESETASGKPSPDNRPFRGVQKLQRGKASVKKMGMNQFILENATHAVMDMLNLPATDSTMTVLNSLSSPLSPNLNRIRADEKSTTANPSICPYPSYTCSVDKYRSFDGSCNNLNNPLWGRAMTPLKRNLAPEYGDGLNTLRKATDGSSLPSAREVSTAQIKDADHPEAMHTLMLMQWGQFLDHDITLTAITKLPKDPDAEERTVDIECGEDGCDETAHPACAPIHIPTSDPAFKGTKTCLEFVRSEGVPNVDCKMGPRQQLNQLTSYIDASHIYGSSKEEAEKLRDMSDTSRGKLKVSDHPDSRKKKLLPTSNEDDMCLERQSTCYLAGDERVNEQTGLTALHVIWLREHNRIEEELHKLKPEWSGETLYQEARRIVGAMQQQITYGEFLPVVLGPIVMKKYELNLLEEGFYTGYSASVDASASNVFATAAFRFGHSLLSPIIRTFNSEYKDIRTLKLSQLFFHPNLLLDTSNDFVDGIVRGTCSHTVQKFDKFITDEVTNKLFSDAPPNGLGTDLASLNIQRSRDHGIPGYNAWREWCGLRKANSFNELVEMDATSRETFSKLYKSVDDIDIFPGGLAEAPVEGSLLGPTFSCIIGREFQRFRKGDRFWYENNGQFTEAQLKEIRNVKLAKIICENGDNITTIQSAVFEQPFREAYPDRNFGSAGRASGLSADWYSQLWTANYNAKTSCDFLHGIDLSLW